MLNWFVRSRTLPFVVSCLLHVGLVAVLLVAEQWVLTAFAKPPVLPVELVTLEEPAPPPPPLPEKAPPPAPKPPKALTPPKPIETPMPQMAEPTPPPEPQPNPIIPEPAPAAPVVPERTVVAPHLAPSAPPANAPVTASKPAVPAPSVESAPPSAANDSDAIPIGRSAAVPPPRETSPDAGITHVARPQGGYQVRPSYPANARRQGVQGTTLLKVHVLIDGRVGQVVVQESAGHPELDQAAADAVRRWRFEPARRGPQAVAMWVLLPVEFRLR